MWRFYFNVYYVEWKIESRVNRFQNTRTRQKDHGILCWRLLTYKIKSGDPKTRLVWVRFLNVSSFWMVGFLDPRCRGDHSISFTCSLSHVVFSVIFILTSGYWYKRHHSKFPTWYLHLEHFSGWRLRMDKGGPGNFIIIVTWHTHTHTHIAIT